MYLPVRILSMCSSVRLSVSPPVCVFFVTVYVITLSVCMFPFRSSFRSSDRPSVRPSDLLSVSQLERMYVGPMYVCMSVTFLISNIKLLTSNFFTSSFLLLTFYI